ncbi:MAG: RNA-binding protein [Alphaproteobacteria bacterium]
MPAIATIPAVETASASDRADVSPAGPLRRCLATGNVCAMDGMVRFAIGPDRSVVPDVAGRLPGHGYWVTATHAALADAVRRKLFSRAARREVATDPGLVDLVERQLQRRTVDLLAMARRAGLVSAGFEKVRGAVRERSVVAVVTAADAAEDAVRKIAGPATGLAWVRCLAGAEIGLAFGKENVVHAALRPGALTDRFLREANRLEGFRPVDRVIKA